MSTTPEAPAKPAAPAAPAAAMPPPAAPAKPAAPVTPPIPAAQAASNKQPASTAKNTSSRTPPDAPPTLDNEMKKLAEEHFKPKGEAKPAEAAAPVAPEAKPADAKTTEPTKPAPTAAADEDHLGIPEPKGMSAENLGNWKSWRDTANKKIGEAKAEAAAIQSKLKTYETASPADSDKAAKLELKLKEVQDRLAVYDLKSHPDFVQQYVQPKQNALKEAAEIVAYNGKEGVNLAAVLDKPLKEFNAEVSEITKDMNGMDATSVQTALRQAYKLANDERVALSKSGELKQQLEAKAAAAARQAFERTRDEIKSKVPVLPIPDGASEETIAEFSEYNNSVAAALAEAENNSFGKISEADVARISHEAAMLKPMSKLFRSIETKYKTVTKLNQELSAELAAIKKGKSPGQFTESGQPSKPDTSQMDVRQLAKEMLGGKDPRG